MACWVAPEPSGEREKFRVPGPLPPPLEPQALSAAAARTALAVAVTSRQRDPRARPGGAVPGRGRVAPRRRARRADTLVPLPSSITDDLLRLADLFLLAH